MLKRRKSLSDGLFIKINNMPLHIYKIQEYDHRAETEQFEAVAAQLAAQPDDHDNLLIGNYNLNGVEVDALLVTSHGITVLEFKNRGGRITARENGAWTAGGQVVAGGAQGNPYVQARRNRSRVTTGLTAYLHKNVTHRVRACIVFNQPADIDNQLPPAVTAWLMVCDMAHFAEAMSQPSTGEHFFSNEELLRIPLQLRIGEFCKDGEPLTDVGAMLRDAGDTAGSYYAQLERIADADLPIRRKYTALGSLLKRFVEQSVAESPLHFAGMFAKIDYLVKENDIPAAVARLIHDTRHALRAAPDTDEEALRRSLPHDLKAVAFLVYHVSATAGIPASLARHFPKADREKRWGRFETDCLRGVVTGWNDDYIYVTAETDGTALTVCYGAQNIYLTREGKGDWTYLRNILCEGAQINLVRLRYDDDVCMPELIIYEPDYLINVTTVAACFETYAESPFVQLINKLKPQPNTEHIHLGNLSGCYLDDTVHRRDVTFGDSFMDFFRHNAIPLVSCDAMNSASGVAKFYDEAKKQRLHIQQLIGHDLPLSVKNYDARHVMLEPTFFCETLGMQGRLDFLYERDGEVTIIEQKSGKGAFVRAGSPGFSPDVPEPQEKHLVQLILYRALFAYGLHKGGNRLQHVMLLYSKYAKGLVSIAQRPELMLRAIRMRNLLAYCELQYARHGLHLLERITPQSLNQKQIGGRLWTDYVQPQLEQTLAPIREATPLERAYYLRFMQFLEKEQMLSKLGNKTKDDSGFAAIWHDTPEEKKAAGNIYDELTIAHFGLCGESVESVTLRFPEAQSADTSNFRKGDIVILYPYAPGSTPQACAQMVIRASIRDITPEEVEVVLRNPQADVRVFAHDTEVRWAIEHDLFDSSTGTLYSGLHGFLSATKPRRDLVLSQRKPEIDTTVTLRGDYGNFNPLVLRAKRARDLFLVIGPPGTGKTSFGLLNILQEELLEPDTRVLLLSYTNRAVDEICSKLCEPGTDIDFIRIGSELACEPQYHGHLLSRRVKQCRKGAEVRQMMERTRVFCATTAALNAHIQLFGIVRFDLAIVDESSQILEPYLVGLLGAKCGERDAIGRVVLIGDHKQLPAVVQQGEAESRVTEPELRDINLTDCRLSLFERLLAQFKTPTGYDARYVYMLTRQGRMHKDIAAFPNYAFYANKLEIVPLEHQAQPCTACSEKHGIARLLTTRRIAFVASPPVEMTVSPKTNAVEADMIAATVMQIYRLNEGHFDANKTVGVIVPYRNQIATVRNAVDRSGVEVLHDITIDTVERYQGSQRDYIIYGFTVQQPYQLNFLANNVFEEDGQVIDRKLNVAMTRARLHLVLIGNPDILAENYTFYKLLEYVRSKGGYFSVAPEAYCNGQFDVPEEGQVRAPWQKADNEADERFEQAFRCEVLQQLREDARTMMPDYVLGNTEDVNLTLINYGRADFADDLQVWSAAQSEMVTLTPDDQVRLYAFYLMRGYYAEARAAYATVCDRLCREAALCGGRVMMVDVGCGPATCGLAWAGMPGMGERQLTYVGVDTSASMKRLAARLMHDVHTGVHCRFVSTLADLSMAGWATDSELPRLVLFNFAHFFVSTDGRTAERMATRMVEIMRQNPLNKYVVMVQHGAHEARLRSYEVFKNCLAPYVERLKTSALPAAERDAAPSTVGVMTGADPFSTAFEIFVGK